jgi:hypothetical protein
MEMPKPTWRYHFKLTRMAIVRKVANDMHWLGCGEICNGLGNCEQVSKFKY